MTTLYWYDGAGYLGVVLVLLAFLLLQAHKLHGTGLTYQLMNLVGALRKAMAITGYSDVKEFQRVEVVIAPYHQG